MKEVIQEIKKIKKEWQKGCTRDDYGKKGLCVHCILEIEKYTSNELEIIKLK